MGAADRGSVAGSCNATAPGAMLSVAACEGQMPPQGHGPCEPDDAHPAPPGLPYCADTCAVQAGYRARTRAAQAFGILAVLLNGVCLLAVVVYRNEDAGKHTPLGLGPKCGAWLAAAAVLCAWITMHVCPTDRSVKIVHFSCPIDDCVL